MTRPTIRGPRGSVVLLVLALLVAACGSGAASGGTTTSAGDGELSIVATTSILGDVARQVAGDAGEVSIVMPPGSDPHNFEPSAQQLVQMQQADLIVANGANLEETLQDALAEAENAGVPVFHATDHIETLAFDGGHAEDEHATEHVEDEHTHAPGSADPHFWQDPVRMASVARALGEQIGELTDDPRAVEQRADDYAAQLEDLEGEISETLADIPEGERTLVTSHEAFNYFADRYDFTIVGTVIPSSTTGAEPSAQDLEELASTIEEEQVPAVFAENTASEQLAETLAQEAGTEVEVIELYSDSLGGEGSGATTYADMLRTNAQRISDALGG